MTTVWADRQLYFQPPIVPNIVGLRVRAVDPQSPEDDDGRRWTHKGGDRWLLYRSGIWSFSAIVNERGAAVAVEFVCPSSGCGNIETATESMLTGHCRRCGDNTGFSA